MCYAKNGRLIPTAKRGKEIKQSEINIYCTCSLLFYFFSSLRRGYQSTVFCVVSFDFN